MSVIASCVFVLAFPYSLFEQPTVVQVLLSVVASVVLIGPVVQNRSLTVLKKQFDLSFNLDTTAKLFITPLLILCLLLGNVKKLALVAAAVVAPLVLLAR